MSNETWARVSLRISSERLTAVEIGQLIAIASTARSGTGWAMDLTTDSGIDLTEQLAIVKDLIREKITILEQIAQDGDINLSIGWTPRSPQDGILLDSELIELLARVGC
jgi:hypothetical protein